MVEPVAEGFGAAFDEPPTCVASAPGRVNLLGEHTDYNDGFVLPIATPQRTAVALRARPDKLVQARSASFPRTASYRLGQEARDGTWLDYLKGVTRGLTELGISLSGFEAFFLSDVPVGAGLSSSAALSVSLLRGLRELFGLALDDVALAKVAQWGENHVVGAPVGIMDPMACQLADTRTALFLDTRQLKFERLPLPASVDLVVVDSGVRHSHATGDYRTRRRECEEAARLLGVPALRDVAVGDPRLATLPPPLDRRARHVVSENERVLAAVAALRADDAGPLGALFDASHRSMRDDFEVSHPAVDALVERAGADGRVRGARMTGGGFGGAVVMLVEPGTALAVGRGLATGQARLLIPRDPDAP